MKDTWRELVVVEATYYSADGSNARLPDHHDIRDDSGKVDFGRYALPADEWKPSIHMFRWMSRITLEVTGVRVERVQDISEADAIAEGVDAVSMADVPRQATMNRRSDFKQLWDSINAKRGYGWDANPWVWVVEFRRAA